LATATLPTSQAASTPSPNTIHPTKKNTPNPTIKYSNLISSSLDLKASTPAPRPAAISVPLR
ncbi:MAG: hypothetical protein NWS80_00675, partial [Akkermansiaceae bacterium]|nr:hypothetical protein [Akkermansiaceae bacterium]